MKRIHAIAVLLGLGVTASSLDGADATHPQAEQRVQYLHEFAGGNDGANPVGPLVADSQGNLYGSTTYGGGGSRCYVSSGGCGTIFELSPTKSENILFKFGDGKQYGEFPNGALLLDSSGAIYGTTTAYGPALQGTAFKLSPDPSRRMTILHSFSGGADGGTPSSGLVMDGHGALYGTTSYGGSGSGCMNNTCGTVYKLTPHGKAYSETVIHVFQGSGDGSDPKGNLLLDSHGSIYGTTATGAGASGSGTVFELTPRGSAYTERILYQLGGKLRQYPRGDPNGIAADVAGNLYVSAFTGGLGGCPNRAYGCGAAIKLTPRGSTYRAQHIYNFTRRNKQAKGGLGPTGAFVIDASGAVYGSAGYGGGDPACAGTDYTYVGCGTLFEMTPTSSGYTYDPFYHFELRKGGDPGPLYAAGGTLYGTTSIGGKFGFGTVFKVVPP